MSEKQPEPRYLAIGRILRPHGVRGELRAQILTDYPEHIAAVKTLYLGESYQPYALLGVRFHQGAMLLTLQGCTTRDAAAALQGALVNIALADAVPLDKDEYYHFQVIGMQVETDSGEALGQIVDVFTVPGANDVFVVHGVRGEILLPVIADVVLNLDIEAGRVLVHLLPGLLDGE